MEPQIKNNVLITGASGLLGTAITSRLDHPWKALHHGDPGWDPEKGRCDSGLIEGSSVVIHLAGEPIAAGRWTETQKKKIYTSRVNGTRALAESMASLDKKPATLICASAVGFFGNRGEEVLHESSSAGDGFLPEVVKDWESAADPAREAGIRVVHLRLGVVLSSKGGALKKMLPAFKWGLGGKLGNGRMWMSWIDLEDAANAFVFAMRHPEMKGAYNLTSPNPVRNLDFTKCLGRALRKPTFLPAPAPVLKLVLGEMGETLLLHSTRVQPTALSETGYTFRYPDLRGCLQNQLNV